MRLISLDGSVDILYDLVSLSISDDGYIIATPVCGNVDPFVIAEYSSVDMAIAAIEKLHKTYTLMGDAVFQFPEEDTLARAKRLEGAK